MKMDVNKESDSLVYADKMSVDDTLVQADEECDEMEDILTLTDLPEVVLVTVMEYLDLKERYSLSKTCHLFYEMFSHPKLWQVAYIFLVQTGDRGKNRLRGKLKCVMHHTMVEIVKRFSHLFKHLTLQMPGFVQKFDDNSLKMLTDLNKECRLESLTLVMGSMTSKDEYMKREANVFSNIRDIPLVVGLVRNAVRLKELNIISWPLHRDFEDYFDIFKGIMENKKLQYLEYFNFFFLNKRSPGWTERIPVLPSVETTINVVSHLTNLKRLSLRSPMLSDELLLMLASKNRRKLESLEILVMFSQDSMYMDGFKIPEISSSTWITLKLACPNLKVECFVITRVPEEQLSLMLNSELPLNNLSILTHGRCDGALIYSLADKYKSHLCKFESLCDSIECDRSLLYLVENCKNLCHLKYHGEVSYRTVIKISKMIKERSQPWSCLEFKEKSIKTDDSDLEEDETEDLAVARDSESQQYYLVSLRKWHQDEDERQIKLDAMRATISENLGHSWWPL